MNNQDQVLFDTVISKLKTDIKNPIYADYDRKFNSFNYKNTDNKPIDAVEVVTKAYFDRETHLKVHYRHNQNGSPEYGQQNDTLVIYPIENCSCSQMFYSILLHEITHSTGARSRLHRDGFEAMDFEEKCDFEDEGGVACEELIAEISSTFLCAKLGINDEGVYNSHASYIKGWKDGPHISDERFDDCVVKAKQAVNYIFEGVKS